MSVYSYHGPYRGDPSSVGTLRESTAAHARRLADSLPSPMRVRPTPLVGRSSGRTTIDQRGAREGDEGGRDVERQERRDGERRRKTRS